MYVIAELKKGRAVVIDGDPYLITWNQFSKAARQGGCMATKMKSKDGFSDPENLSG